MKRWISALLIFALFFGALPVTASAVAAEEAEIDEAALQQALDYAMQHPELTDELSVDYENGVSLPAKREEPADNLIMPGPLMEGCAAKKGDVLPLPVILYQTGKINQAAVILLFKGSTASGNPVKTIYARLTSEEGVFEGNGEGWRTKDAALGTYTAVTCTASMWQGQYTVIPGTASSAHVYVLDHYVPVTSYYYTDEKGNRLDKLTTDGTTYSYAYIRHEPAIATGVTDIVFSRLGSIGGHFYEYAGLIIGYPSVYGWGQLEIRPNFSSLGDFYLDVEVCVHKDGHRPEVTVLRGANEQVGTATLYYCPDCHTSKLEEGKSTIAIFNELYDLQESAWYYESVKGAVQRGLFNGVTPNRFRPNDTMTRAMLVTVLWRYAGAPAEGKNTFSDVAPGQWYTDAVAWAAHNHIVDGVGGGRFAPNDTITREQMAAILYRYAASIEEDTSARADLDGFADRAKVSAWSNDPLRWCVAEGYIGGSEEGGKLLLVPQGGATRAQVAAILMRFLKKVDPTMKYVPLDTTGAEASGTYTHWLSGDVLIEWAFFPDGTLVFGKDGGWIPAAGSNAGATQPERYEMPWDAYIERTKTIKILNGVTSIGTVAFRDYPNLETVLLPDSLHDIGGGAFMGCASLKTIRWPESYLSISGRAFSGCNALEEVVLPEGVNSVGSAFMDCTGLKRISFPESLLIAGAWTTHHLKLSGCVSLTDVHLPTGTTGLPSGCFQNCKALERVDFPKALSFISYEVFDGCESIKTMVLPPEVCTLEDEAFCEWGSSRDPDYVTTCGLTELYILNPLLEPRSLRTTGGTYGKPVFYQPFGDPTRVTVHGYRGTKVEALALAAGYNFVPLN